MSNIGKDLPDYEEIPIPVEMPADVYDAYKETEKILRNVLRDDRRAAQKLLSAYLNLLTVYPDQPYDNPDIVHPLSGRVIVSSKSLGDFNSILQKEEKTLEIVQEKIDAGERVLIYTSWTRTDSQKKLLGLLTSRGIRTKIMTPAILPEKREEWVENQLRSGLQVLITNPRCGDCQSQPYPSEICRHK